MDVSKFAGVTKEREEKKKQMKIDLNPIKIWIDDITQEGNVTIKFNQPLEVPTVVKDYLAKKHQSTRRMTQLESF